MKLKEVYNLWIPVKRRQVKESTIACYALLYRNIISSEFGECEVSEMNKKRIVPFLFQCLDKGMSRKYCSDILILIKMLIRFAGEEFEEDIPDTTWKITWPTKNLDESPNKIESYTEKECKKITEYILENPSPRNLGILLAISSGMRIGEICALQWKDFDFEKKEIHVRRTIERIYSPDTGGTKIIIGSPKTISSNRNIPISSFVYRIAKKFSEVCNMDYYVCSCSPKFVEPRTFRTYYKDLILNGVGLDHCIKFHGLRHTFASTLISNKVDVKTVSTLLGHSDVSTTLNVYVHPSDDTKRVAINSGLKKLFR